MKPKTKIETDGFLALNSLIEEKNGSNDQLSKYNEAVFELFREKIKPFLMGYDFTIGILDIRGDENCVKVEIKFER